MAVLDIHAAAGGDDAASFHNHSGFTTNNSGWIPMQQHVNTSLATTTGWRFKIPSTIDPATITSVKLMVRANGTGATSFAAPFDVRVEKLAAVAFANDTAGRPSNRHDAAVAAGATQRSWNPTAVSDLGVIPGAPDLAVDIVAAMTAGWYTPGTSYVGILAKAPIAGPLTIQALDAEIGDVPARPTLRITYTDPSPTWPAITATDVIYHDGVGYFESRRCDIRVPAGAPSPSGRPTVVWLHGGFWRTGFGDRTTFPTGMRDALLAAGYTVVNSSYKLVAATITVSNTWASFPDPVHDMGSMMRFLNDPDIVDKYQIDTDNIFLVGASAGGHVALSAALGLKDASNYTGYQNTSNNRSTSNGNAYNFGNTRPTFDLDAGKAGTNPMPRGVFLIAAPIDMGAAAGHPDGAINTAINLGRTGYMGQNQGVNPNTTIHDELDLNKYIKGTSNVYGSTPKMPTVPIGYAYAENDPTVLPAYGHLSLLDALSVHSGYETPAVGTPTQTGLTRVMIPGANHDTAHSDSDTPALVVDWMEMIMEDSSPLPLTVGEGQVGALHLGEDQVDALYLGDAQIF